MNRDLKEKDRVVLDVDHKWRASEYNPIGVKGTVTEVDSWVYVQWDNGCENAYMGEDCDLILVQKES